MLRRPFRKLYKLELYAESDNLPPIASSSEDSDKDDAMQVEEVELMDGKEEEVECQVTLPQKTRRRREVARPRRFKN